MDRLTALLVQSAVGCLRRGGGGRERGGGCELMIIQNKHRIEQYVGVEYFPDVSIHRQMVGCHT